MVMANPNIHSLNALVTGYIKNDKPKQALLLYHQMQKEDLLYLNQHTILGLLKACGKCKDIGIGLRIHVLVVGMGLIHLNVKKVLLDKKNGGGCGGQWRL